MPAGPHGTTAYAALNICQERTWPCSSARSLRITQLGEVPSIKYAVFIDAFPKLIGLQV